MICIGYKVIIIATANNPIGPPKRNYEYHIYYTHKIVHPNPKETGKKVSKKTPTR